MADTDKAMKSLVEYLRKHNLHEWAATAEFLRKASNENKLLKDRVVEAEAANELDRSRIPFALAALNTAVHSRDWTLEGRGPYEWDDDDYMAEFSLWVDAVREAAELFAKIAIDWHGCPVSQTEIRHARAMLGAAVST
jgi:aryl-phospho-beta-D-glucosidase BglC (GH1 family)